MENFDYIVVGAGSSGSVIANRLSENNKIKICVIEAGGSNQHPYVKMPAGFIKTINDKGIDIEKFSAGGLSEFIRLAKSSEILWSDIFKSNLENIEEDTKAFIKNMHDLLEEASKNDSKSLLKKIQLIKKGVS